MTFMHAHAADELRRRLGPDADPLMRAAGAGDGIALMLLERLGKADAVDWRPGLHPFSLQIGGRHWHGNSLRIVETLPETVAQAMLGQPLGRVVEGTPCSDRRIQSVTEVQGGPGHWITIDADLLDTSELRRPGIALRYVLIRNWMRTYMESGAWSGPFRTAAGGIVFTGMAAVLPSFIMVVNELFPGHLLAMISAIITLIFAYSIRPRREWRRIMKDHLRLP